MSDPPEADCESPVALDAANLKRRIAEAYRISPANVLLQRGVDDGLETITTACTGPFVGFPPSAAAAALRHARGAGDLLWVARGTGRNAAIDVETAADLPGAAIAVVDSPSNPLGSLLSPIDAVRLARACRFLVVDERFAEYGGFSLLPLVAEFDNIVVLRSFETWAGIQSPPCAWIAASPRAAACLGLTDIAPDPAAAALALAALDDLTGAGMLFRLVRDERSRLFRLLRKFSFLEPLPSWGPFVSARVHVTTRDALVTALQQRGVRIHSPEERGLERYTRFGIGPRAAMEHLRRALADAAPKLLG